VFALISYFPALLISNTHDSAGYIASARNAFFWTGEEPSGYPLFLRLVHAISHDLWFTVALQHALGILAGLLLLLAALRLGAPLLIALAPALVLWLNGDQLFLEQAPLSEAVFTFLLVLSVYAAVRTLEGSSRWGAILGASLTGLVVTRTVGVPLPVVVLGSLVIATWRLRLRWHPVASALASLVALLASYSFATHLETGRWSPLARHTSWHLYSRAAEFADSTRQAPGSRLLRIRRRSGDTGIRDRPRRPPRGPVRALRDHSSDGLIPGSRPNGSRPVRGSWLRPPAR
jgi:4-amino-4-deoxy-L-arabinose transferase-like glycosyltransferase